MLPQGSVQERLLEYFRAHSGRALTREELSLQIWKFQLDQRSRVIDQTVSLIRRKLEEGERIITVHLQGYRHERLPSP